MECPFKWSPEGISIRAYELLKTLARNNFLPSVYKRSSSSGPTFPEILDLDLDADENNDNILLCI